jgi:hypothetical protein
MYAQRLQNANQLFVSQVTKKVIVPCPYNRAAISDPGAGFCVVIFLWLSWQGKGQFKFVHAMEAYVGSEVVASFIINHGSRS